MSADLHIRTLGGVSLTLKGQPVTGLPSRKAEALLIYLACNQRPFPREILAELLWDERDPQQASANLRSVLSSLRRALKPYLTITRQSVAFNSDSSCWLDAAAFAAQAGAALAGQQPGHTLPAESAARLQQAVDLYTGDFLAGFFLAESRGLEEWIILQRERLHRLATTALLELSRYYLHSGDYQAGEKQTDHLLTLEPLSEVAHRQMMIMLARQGRRSAALAQYQSCHRLLTDELDVAPTAQTRALYERIRSAGSMSPHNLPPRSTRFVGRQAEMAKIQRRLLDPACRLLTLLGPGGAGKTRLAVETLEQLLAGHPGAFLHGLRFVSLTGVHSAESLSAAVADTLGLAFEGARSPQEQLLAFLSNREVLLLLDNFEHLLSDDDCFDFVEQVLAQAPLVKLLVTSQERLNLHQEWLFDVSGLPYPEQEAAAETVATFEAVQLFVQNAARIRSNFVPTPADLAGIGRVSRLLEGMPLGLELASAWVRQHTCPEIADQIAKDLDFLATSLRNVPERHRSLRAVFERSWQLLTVDEQSAAVKLAIFRGPIDPRAAAEVTGISAAVLPALVNKSFLRPVAENGRFEMHELLRKYAAEKLAGETAVWEQLWAGYRRYYVDFLAVRAERLKSGSQHEAIHEITVELENVRAVWNEAVNMRRRNELAEMLPALYWFYWQRGTSQEGADTLTRAAETIAAEAQTDDLLLARLRSRQAEFHSWLSDFETATRLLTESIATFRQLDAKEQLAWALDALGNVNYYQGEYGVAKKCLSEALAIFRKMGKQSGLAQSLNSLAGVVGAAQANYQETRTLYEESLALYRELGDRYGQAKVIINLGVSAHMLAEYDQARAYYREGIEICRRLGHRQALAIALNNLGQVVSELGDHAEAETYLQESVSLRHELGDRRGLGITLKSWGDLAVRQEKYGPAQEQYHEALRIGLALPSKALLAEVFVSLAAMLGRLSKPMEAADLLAVVVEDGTTGQELLNKIRPIMAQLETDLTGEQLAAARQRNTGKTIVDVAGELLHRSIKDNGIWQENR